MNFQITEYCHHILEEYIEEGDICIDATAGNGGDTEFLCQKVGETGNVYAFDVQEMAIAHTRERLEKANLSTRAKLIQSRKNADLCKRRSQGHHLQFRLPPRRRPQNRNPRSHQPHRHQVGP